MRTAFWISILWSLGQWGLGSTMLPPLKFLDDFVQEHSLLGTVLYIPLSKFSNDIIPYRKQARTKVMKVVDMDNPKIRKQNRQNIVDLQVVLDLNSSVSFLADMIGSQTNNDYWLIGVTGMNIPVIKSILDTFAMVLDDQIYLYDIQDTRIILYEAYKVHATKKARFQRIGYWSTSERLQIQNDEIWQRRADLEGIEFKIATLYSPPYLTAKIPINQSDSGAPGSYAMAGMFADVFLNLKEIMNFTFVVTKPEDEQWGAVNSDGITWSGMVGMLQNKEIDMAITDFTVTVERSLVITFAEPITQIYHSLFIKNPTGTPHYMAYVEPLHWMVWGTLGLLILFTPPVLYLSASFGSYDVNRREFTLGKSYVFTTGVLTSRGWDLSPSSLKARVAFFSLLLGGTLVFWHWEAMLISYLATRVIVLPFESLQGLVEGSDFRISLTPGSSYMDAFKQSQDPLWQKAWKDRIETNLATYPKSTDDHTKSILRDTSLAYYDNFFAVRTLPVFADCEIIAIPAKYDVKPYAYGFQKDSPYLGLFNHYLKQLRERGTTKKILEKYDSRPQVCPDYSGKPLGLNNCFTAFVCLILGLLVGLALLVIEKSAQLISDFTGLSFNWLYSYGKMDPLKEDQVIMEDANLDFMAKVIIQEKSKRIRDLEDQLNLYQNGSGESKSSLSLRRRRKERMIEGSKPRQGIFGYY
ncbi:glutamate receptor ionotropic, kainate 5-like [Tigriopus californicus]|uniref:glutamate receptor ionotropic, kainate 5-like n=1 Tax=Tigriopus californicus TaxID=6832 RepID=UPI0027DA65C6|nr:glutamate receptor ionotropic, kainate 5-like [Tigriopus californicus]